MKIIDLADTKINVAALEMKKSSDLAACTGMFKREEASRIRQEFWTTFGKYMAPIRSSEGLRVNWLNYHTRVKDIYFRMDAGAKSASISISIEHRDEGIRELYFEQFQELRNMLHEFLNEEWNWQMNAEVEGRPVNRIFKQIDDVSVFDKAQWPELISFFKPRIIALDAFWENARYSFDDLK